MKYKKDKETINANTNELNLVCHSLSPLEYVMYDHDLHSSSIIVCYVNVSFSYSYTYTSNFTFRQFFFSFIFILFFPVVVSVATVAYGRAKYKKNPASWHDGNDLRVMSFIE